MAWIYLVIAGLFEVGWAIGLIRQDPRTHGPGGRVYGLAVGPEARGLGVGGTLFTRLLAELGKRGVQLLCTHLNVFGSMGGYYYDDKYTKYYHRG